MARRKKKVEDKAAAAPAAPPVRKPKPPPPPKAQYTCTTNLVGPDREYFPNGVYEEDDFILQTCKEDAENGYPYGRFFQKWV